MTITKDKPVVRTQTGNLIDIKMAGESIGMLQDLRASDDYSPEPASGIGDIHVTEYVPTMARHTLSTSAMVLDSNSLRAKGISLLNGDDALKGQTFTIEVFQKNRPGAAATSASNSLRKYEGVTFVSGDIEIRKHAIVITNAQFNALNVSGEGL